MEENKSVSVNDFGEEYRWVIECPYCDELTEAQEDPSYLDDITCDHCYKTIDINH